MYSFEHLQFFFVVSLYDFFTDQVVLNSTLTRSLNHSSVSADWLSSSLRFRVTTSTAWANLAAADTIWSLSLSLPSLLISGFLEFLFNFLFLLRNTFTILPLRFRVPNPARKSFPARNGWLGAP